MRIISLARSTTVYSCNSYLILGDWNHINDVNTVIDPGTDDFIIDEIERLSTGCGKVPVAQVILTHNHFDHAGGVKAIKERYNARVLAFSEGPGIDGRLCDGQFIKAGDDILEVLHTPGHSSDSICLYAPSRKTLFAGDIQLRVRWPEDAHSIEYVKALLRIARRDIHAIYSGHDAPIVSGCQAVLQQTLHNIRGTEGVFIHTGGD